MYNNFTLSESEINILNENDLDYKSYHIGVKDKIDKLLNEPMSRDNYYNMVNELLKLKYITDKHYTDILYVYYSDIKIPNDDVFTDLSKENKLYRSLKITYDSLLIDINNHVLNTSMYTSDSVSNRHDQLLYTMTKLNL